MISSMYRSVFDRRRNPGSMAVAGPGAPIVNSKAILCAGLLCRGRTQNQPRVPVRFLIIWTAFSDMSHGGEVTASPRPWPSDLTSGRYRQVERQLGF